MYYIYLFNRYFLEVLCFKEKFVALKKTAIGLLHNLIHANMLTSCCEAQKP